MVRVYYSDRFRKSAKRLNKKQQAQLARLVVLLKENPFNPVFHTKSLSGRLTGIYSFRTTREYRALFRFLSPEEILLMDVGDRKDIYR